MKKLAFSTEATFLKVSDELGLIFGFAMICKVEGEDYFDLGEVDSDGIRVCDYIPEDVMLEAALDFMQNSRVAGVMHKSAKREGDIVFAFPLTSEIAAALDITTKRTGLLVAMKPDSQETLDKARSGEYRGFSIGGYRIEDEFVE